MDPFLWAFWLYLVIAILSLAVPVVFIIWRIKPETWFGADVADEFTWLTEAERKRLNFHFNREKALLDSWRQSIVILTACQYYCTFYSVVSSVLIAAIAPLARGGNHGQWLLSLISVHLAVTIGLYKTFKVEKTLLEGLRYENSFYSEFYHFQDAPQDFGDKDKRVDNYLKKYGRIRDSFYQAELSAIPSAHEARHQ